MPDCLFCSIAQRTVHAEVVRETERVVVFEDVRPQAPVHLLAIPRQHAETIAELSIEDGALVSDLVAEACRAAKDAGLFDGYRLVWNVGSDGGQTVNHVHLHVLGGRRMTWPPG